MVLYTFCVLLITNTKSLYPKVQVHLKKNKMNMFIYSELHFVVMEWVLFLPILNRRHGTNIILKKDTPCFIIKICIYNTNEHIKQPV